jgi:hypothetical protein
MMRNELRNHVYSGVFRVSAFDDPPSDRKITATKVDDPLDFMLANKPGYGIAVMIRRRSV